MKTHAKDYLKDLIQGHSWEAQLINEAIITNGDIPKESLNKIYQKLLHNDNTPIKSIISEKNDNNEDEFKIKKFVHNKGVCALEENQTINFSPDCTVLYGLNGSGKSSYFKVLNELSGGNIRKEIISNIYADAHEEIDIDITYEQNGNDKTIKWSNAQREVPPFDKIRVFDSSYLHGLLGERVADKTIVQPFGLHLFNYITTVMKEFKEKLIYDSRQLHYKKPHISTVKFSKNIKDLFNGHNGDIKLTKELKIFIENKYNFSEKNKLKLAQLITRVNTLKQNNKSQIVVKSQQRTGLVNIKNELLDKIKKLLTEIDESKILLEQYDKYLQLSKDFKKDIKVLDSIPAIESPEWKTFIKSAEAYNSTFDTVEKDTCIYCRQSLNINAIEILKAYSSFLNNDSETKLSQTLELISQKINSLEKMQVNFESFEILDTYLRQEKFDTETSLFDALKVIKGNWEKTKQTLINNLKDKSLSDLKQKINIDKIIEVIENKIVHAGKLIKDLNSDDEEKDRLLLEAEKNLNSLYENQEIASQKENIENWISLHENAKLIDIKTMLIKPRKISNLSDQAHSELLTPTLKVSFKAELQKLKQSHLDINLVKVKIANGHYISKLELTKHGKLTSILSEGEQKAVALALFIAEVNMQKQNNPIIIDDPVNSLDHEIAGYFAQRLLDIDNQAIIFTHNKLFLDAFETSKKGHICKNIVSKGCTNNKGKHIFLYTVQSEGKSSKGIIIFRKVHKAKTHADSVQKILQKSPFDNTDKACVKLRKTVECLIDEKIFNNQAPTRFSSKNNRIHWDELKRLNPDDKLIDTLKDIHDRVSGGSMHGGTESEENPIGKDELDSMHVTLSQYIN
jgi:energy-coupling factor transporter ATP-binding protein EcfA2